MTVVGQGRVENSHEIVAPQTLRMQMMMIGLSTEAMMEGAGGSHGDARGLLMMVKTDMMVIQKVRMVKMIKYWQSSLQPHGPRGPRDDCGPSVIHRPVGPVIPSLQDCIHQVSNLFRQEP